MIGMFIGFNILGVMAFYYSWLNKLHRTKFRCNPKNPQYVAAEIA